MADASLRELLNGLLMVVLEEILYELLLWFSSFVVLLVTSSVLVDV